MVPHWAVGKETEVFYLILNKTTTISHSIIFSNSLVHVTPKKETICDAFALWKGKLFVIQCNLFCVFYRTIGLIPSLLQNRIQNLYHAEVFAYSDIEDDESIPQEITFWLAVGDIN